MHQDSISRINRRKFLKVGTGVSLAITAGFTFQLCNTSTKNGVPVALTPWVKIKPDNTVIIFNPAAEMGQGSMTALPLILAEEMDVDWKSVKIEHSPIDASIYGHDGWGSQQMMLIVGSYAVQGFFDKLREAGGFARQILISMAANKWEINADHLSTREGSVIDPSSDRTITYGELIDAPIPSSITFNKKFKPKSNFKLIGSFQPRRDIQEKTTGEAVYSIDVRLEGMQYAMIKRSPVHGAKPLSFNEKEINALAGVLKVVVMGHGVGIIADSVEHAWAAIKSLVITWDKVSASNYSSYQEMKRYPHAIADDSIEKVTIAEKGDFKSLPEGLNYISRDYYNDYTYHAQMEPLNAVVSVSRNKDEAEIWVGTQGPDFALRDAAKTLGLNESKIKLNRCYLGGGFGRRARRDYLVEACELALHTDKPLKLIWSREEDVKYGMFRPATLQRMTAGVNVDGKIISWEYHTVGSGRVLIHTGSEIPFYSIPNQKLVAHYLDHGVRLCSWRAEGHGPNKFAIEAFIDEIIKFTGADPFAFRLQMMKEHPRAVKTLRTVKKMSEQSGDVSLGRARGLSFCERNSITACVCEISVSRSSGKIHVQKVWIAIDAGIVVQPDNAKAQIEGAIIMSISSSLSEQITFKDGAVEQSNFDNYHLLRCSDAPDEIQIEFIDSEESPTGLGEAGIPAVTGAIANAFASLTGKRLRHMPFTSERVKEALNVDK